MSKYSQAVGQNTWTGGQEIIPLSLDDAKHWAEKYLDADAYEKIFGKIEESKVQVSTWIEESVKAEIDKLRDEQGFTIADIIKAGVNAVNK
jgi:hypothetical protein